MLLSTYKIEKLGDHADIQAGNAFKSKFFTNDSSDIPLVKGENVQQGFIDWDASKFWPRHELDTYQDFILNTGDVVLAMDRPWVTAGLKWAYIKKRDPNALLVQRVCRIKGKNTLDQTYLRCIVSSKYFSACIQPIVTGVNVPHISGKQIGGLLIPLPPITIQKKIADILSAYDELIDNNNQRISLLEQMAEEIYKEWFVRLRFPGHKQTRIVDGVPEGWEQERLGQIVSIKMGQSPKSEFYNNIGNGLPFHQGVKDFGNRFPMHKTYCTDDKRIAERGDILLSVRAPVGRLNIADRKLIIGRGLGAIRHNDNFQSYCYYLLRCIFQIEDSFGNGAVFNAVSKKELANIKIIIPAKETMNRFDYLVEPFDRELELLSQKNKILKQTRDFLLPRLMSGKLSVEQLLSSDF